MAFTRVELVPSGNCAVCFELFDESTIAHNGYHPIHTKCLEIWVRTNPTCPECRAPVIFPKRDLPKRVSLPVNRTAEDFRYKQLPYILIGGIGFGLGALLCEMGPREVYYSDYVCANTDKALLTNVFYDTISVYIALISVSSLVVGYVLPESYASWKDRFKLLFGFSMEYMPSFPLSLITSLGITFLAIQSCEK